MKLTFPLDIDQVSRSRYLFETRNVSRIAFRQLTVNHVGNVTERLARLAIKMTTKELADCTGFGAITVYTDVGQFG